MEDLLSKQYFEEVSDQWDELGGGFFGDAPRDRIYSEIDLKPGMQLADIGSGSGYLIEGLIDRNVSLVAIDQSPAMLQIIRNKFAGKTNIATIEGTSEALPCGDDQMDVVMANMYLHHVEDPAAAILEMTRILKRNGTLVFTDLDLHEFDQLIEEQHDRWKGFDRNEIHHWMEEAGLTDIVIESVGADCCTSSCAGDEIKINIFVAKGIKK